MKNSKQIQTTAGADYTEHALTRLEVVAVLSALALLAIVLAPALANTKGDSDRVLCFNNLRLIGRAVQTWSGDHDQEPPWWIPTAQGGDLRSPKPGGTWPEYAFLSNEIVSPKILACPADQKAAVAPTWGNYIGIGSRGNATSYDLWVHANADTPASALCTDRNARFDGANNGTCSLGFQGFDLLTFQSTSSLAWTNDVHGELGHVLFLDGSAEFTSTARFRELILTQGRDPRGETHVQGARR